jgi:hypothetical protein
VEASSACDLFNVADLGATIFPIIFAAVVGRLMKFLALWRAEKEPALEYAVRFPEKAILEQINNTDDQLFANLL